MANSGSKGILSGLHERNLRSNEDKNLGSKEERNLGGSKEEFSIKRSYSLRASTLKKLKELKFLADEDVTFNEIIDQAICELWDRRKKE
ncbi:hypothetical protein [Desulfosporosinus sp.]|uniref:hypothetical protein n=1 Tax=Desulfosporosinus sp. TaxID=157907 RepID=UPI00230ED73A|nr:hypothetical protein [Desulfosporosinus sp.]MDA8222494.1 hypothetical protein [Desulfitobacterium hafniense]